MTNCIHFERSFFNTDMISDTLRRQSTRSSLPEHPRLVIFGSDGVLPNDVVLTIAKRLHSLHSMSCLSRVNKHCFLAIRPFLTIVKTKCRFDIRPFPAGLIQFLVKHEAAIYNEAGSLFDRPGVLGDRLDTALCILPQNEKNALRHFDAVSRLLGCLPKGLDPSRYIVQLLDALEKLPDNYFNSCCEHAFSTISSPLMMKGWADGIAQCKPSMQERCMAAVLYACAPEGDAATLFVETTLDNMKRVMEGELSPRLCREHLEPLVDVLARLPTRELAFLTLFLIMHVRDHMPRHSASRIAVLTTLAPLDLRLKSERVSNLVGQATGELNTLMIECSKRPRRMVLIIALVKRLMQPQHDGSWQVLRSCMKRCIATLERNDAQRLMTGLQHHGNVHTDNSALIALYECAAVIEETNAFDPFGFYVRERLQAPLRDAATPALIQAITHWMCQAAPNTHFKLDDALLPDLCKAVLNCKPVDQVALLDQVAAAVDAMTGRKKLDAGVAYVHLMAAAACLTAVDYGFFMLCQLPRVHMSERKASSEAAHALGTGFKHWLGLIQNDPSVFDVVLDVIEQSSTRYSLQATFCVTVLDAMSQVSYKNEVHKRAVENVVIDLSWNYPEVHGFLLHLFNGLIELPDGLSVNMIDMLITIFSGNASRQMIDKLALALQSAPDLRGVPIATTLKAVEALVNAAFMLKPTGRSVVTQRNALNRFVTEGGAIDPAYVERYIAAFLQTNSSLTAEVLTSLREWTKSAPDDADHDFERQFHVELFKKCLTAGTPPRPDFDLESALHDFSLKLWDADRTDEAASAVFSHLLKSETDDMVRPDSKKARQQKLKALHRVMKFVEEQLDEGRLSIESFNALVQRAQTIWRACNDSLLGRMPYRRRK